MDLVTTQLWDIILDFGPGLSIGESESSIIFSGSIGKPYNNKTNIQKKSSIYLCSIYNSVNTAVD